MYYNDQPADMILYQGLSYLKLGMAREARARFYRLIDYGERHLDDEVKIQYFAVSLPEFLIFDEDYTMRNRAHCYYLMALGNMGLGDSDKASAFLARAAAVEPSHMMCRVYQTQPAAQTLPVSQRGLMKQKSNGLYSEKLSGHWIQKNLTQSMIYGLKLWKRL